MLEALNYSYDATGNRISMNRQSVSLPLRNDVTNTNYNEANQMLRFNASSDNIVYDENGNMTSMTNSCGTTTYNWDVRNRLSSISGFKPDCSSLTASFKYDALGRRTEKSINGVTTQYLYDGLDIVQEIENSVVSANYIRTLNIDEPLAMVKADGTVRYYQTDALGSVIGLTDETGAVKTQYSYDPFGGIAISSEASDNPFQYTGRENDGTGLYYYRARYYSPDLQRFISEDPILKPLNLLTVTPSKPFNKIVWFLPYLKSDPRRLQSYTYAANVPISFKDPLGLEFTGCDVVCSLVCAPIMGMFCPAAGPAALLCGGLVTFYCLTLCDEICHPPKPPEPPKPPQPPKPPEPPAPPGDGGSTC